MKTGSSASWGAALIAPKQPHRLVAVLDIVVVMGAALALSAYLYPADPLLIAKPFPWLWLAPLLLALRYGTFGAVGASAIMLAAWVFLHMPGRLLSTAVPEQFLLGGLIVTLSAAQFTDIWAGRLKRVRAVNAYLDQRLDALTRRHFLLKHDFERIEQGMLVKPLTLRQSLLGLRKLNIQSTASGAKKVLLPRAQELLQLLAQVCQLEVASLHGENNGRMQAKPVATLGDSAELTAGDPMVVLALHRNELCHVQTDTLQEADSRYLVVAPLIDSTGQRLGVLLIERMPFLCLNTEALQLLGVVLGYYADMVNIAPEVHDICRQLPACPVAFATELVRLDRVYRDSHISSTLVALDFDGKQDGTANLFVQSIHQRRQLDLTWAIQGREQHNSTLLTLMPLYGQAAAKGYVRRIEKGIATRPGVGNLAAAGVSAFSVPVGRQAPVDVLARVLEKCKALEKSHVAPA